MVDVDGGEVRRIFDAGRTHLSFSQLQTYQSCGKKYELSYVQRVEREPQGAFLGGTAIHRAIQEAEGYGWWLDDANVSGPTAPMVARFLEILETKVAEAGGPGAIRWGGRGQGEDLAWWRKQGEFMCRRYVATRQAMEASGWAPITHGVEMRVEATFDEVGEPIVGYLDKFLMHEEGEPLIVDYKSGKIGGAEPMQFATYAALVKATRGIDVERGVAVYLRAPDAGRRVAPMRFADLTERMPRTFSVLARGIDAGLFEPNPSAFCKSCSVRAHCWYWQATEGKEEA